MHVKLVVTFDLKCSLIYTQFLLENHLHGCQIFGPLGFFYIQIQTEFRFPHTPIQSVPTVTWDLSVRRYNWQHETNRRLWSSRRSSGLGLVIGKCFIHWRCTVISRSTHHSTQLPIICTQYGQVNSLHHTRHFTALLLLCLSHQQ